MKSTLIALTIATLALIGTTPQAAAHSHSSSTKIHVSGYTRDGEPIYTQRYLIGYDRCGDPIWGYRAVRQECRVVEYRPRYVAPCPPPVRYYPAERCEGRGYRTGFTIEGSFRR